MRRWIVGSSFTPSTNCVGSSAGRRNNHFFHRRPEVLLRSGPLVNRPVGRDHDIRANTVPVDFRGSFTLKTLMAFPSMAYLCRRVVMVCGRFPIRDHFQKVREGFGVRIALTAATN